ncbi:non-ribosomal peptide synthetase [Streptomyces sp. NPDC058612]|uniref:non-ribosomal peptide synthetase n=1 Tax=Streptomyces sp. NPDC058612 TaxID=3346555 RepID=UPI003650AD3C
MRKTQSQPLPKAPPLPLSIVRGAPAGEPGPGVPARYAYWVRTTPQAVAVEDGPFSWTYGEVDGLAWQLADLLRERVVPGDLVGVCLDRSVALVVTAVAVARLGAVYLPLGPCPDEGRLAAVTERLRVSCLIGSGDAFARTAKAVSGAPDGPLQLPLPLLGANSDGQPVACFPAHAANHDAANGTEKGELPDGTFYAVLTSGSTGTSKAVAVGGASLDAVVAWYNARTGSKPGDRHSLLNGVAFDPHVKELWSALSSGAALAVAPDEVRWDPGCLTTWWRRARVSVSVLPTPLAELVLTRPWPRLTKLRYLEIGGDRLTLWPDRAVTAAVHNSYGPAEATVVTTSHLVHAPTAPRCKGAKDEAEEQPEPEPAAGLPPIGLPMDGAVLVVTNDEGLPVPRGEVGELRIGGAGLALGYLDQELTTRRFVPAPHGVEGVDRVYRTRDRVRMRPDGILDFLGRSDDQVKICGARVEPAEVEAVLEQHPRVHRAVVLPHRTQDGPLGLRAYVLLTPSGAQEPPDCAALRAEAERWLPAQAVPGSVQRVDAFPLDANGKIDRTALPAARPVAPQDPDAYGTETDADDVSAAERHLLSLCRQLLGREQIGLRDSFAASGGTSLDAARLATRLEQHYAIRLRAAELLRQPDLRAIARLVDGLRATYPAGSAAGDPATAGGS